MYDKLISSEIKYFNTIKHNCKVIFDVGAQQSIYINEPCEVHYFDPIEQGLKALEAMHTKNTKSYFNCFGLGDEEKNMAYYDYGAFFDRSIGPSHTVGKYIAHFPVKLGESYIIENSIQSIDFLKIDVEGFELHVLKGFRNKLELVKNIQFEYGIGLADAGDKLIDIVNHLMPFGFSKFSYITDNGLIPFSNYDDNWNWCNIACKNENY